MENKQSVKGRIMPLALALLFFLTLSPERGLAQPLSQWESVEKQAVIDEGMGVRVRLSSLQKPQTLSFEVLGRYMAQEMMSFDLNGRFTVDIQNGQVVLTGGGGQIWGKSITLRRLSGIPSEQGILLFHPVYKEVIHYPADMTFSYTEEGLEVTLYLEMETYLYGVVPYESYDGWPIEALKAQAVAARSYATYQMDVERKTVVQDTVWDQMYKGYDGQFINSIRAVDETHGQILKGTSGDWEGQAILAYFSMSNGGVTEDAYAAGVAMKAYPYFTVKEDPYDAQNPFLGDKNQCFLSKTEPPTGALLELIQSKLTDGKTISGISKITLTAPRYTAPDRAYTAAEVTVWGVSAEEVPFEETVTLTLAELRETVYETYHYRFLTLEEREEGFYLSALRTDHGVGLSQRGAQQRALVGQTYFEILDFYYENTTIAHRHEHDDERPEGLPQAVVLKGRVTADTLNVRSGPGTTYAITGQLYKDDLVDIVEKGESFSLVRTDGLEGYVSNTYVNEVLQIIYTQWVQVQEQEVLQMRPLTAVMPEKQSLCMKGRVIRKAPLRPTPGLVKGMKALGTLPEETPVWIMGAAKGYFELLYQNKVGYISKKAIVLEL